VENNKRHMPNKQQTNPTQPQKTKKNKNNKNNKNNQTKNKKRKEKIRNKNKDSGGRLAQRKRDSSAGKEPQGERGCFLRENIFIDDDDDGGGDDTRTGHPHALIFLPSPCRKRRGRPLHEEHEEGSAPNGRPAVSHAKPHKVKAENNTQSN